MHFQVDPSAFDTNRFKSRICSNLFSPSCNPSEVSQFEVKAGSTVAAGRRTTSGATTEVSFRIKFIRGGPTVNHMRTMLVEPDEVQKALDPDCDATVHPDPDCTYLFPLVLPYEIRMKEITAHRSNDDLVEELNAYKTIGAVNVIFFQVGAWGLAVFWSISARGQACRNRAHSGWRSNIMPSGETLQVLVLSSFFQLIMSIVAHSVSPAPSSSTALNTVYLYGAGIGILGAVFIAVLNAWIRGESISLRKALDVGKIDRAGGSKQWDAADEEADGRTEVEYRQVYEPGSDRTLGGLAAHDWETFHLDMEKKMGLFDMSDNVFDEKPKEDPGMLAAFLNSKLSELFTGKRDEKPREQVANPELMLAPLELPAGLRKTTVRDALLQWRLRHTAHPQESEAVDWMLGQLDPAFELIAVKVPEQARLLLIEALIQHQQNHAELQLDAAHSSRLLSALRKMGNRFDDLEVAVPDDGKQTEKLRELVADAIQHRLEKSKTDITQEEGALLQLTMHAFKPAYSLVAMPYDAVSADDQLVTLKGEIDKRADAVRSTTDDYMYDDEIFTPVPLISRTKPPDHVEELKARRPGAVGKGHRGGVSAATGQPASPSPAAAAPQFPQISEDGSKSELPQVSFTAAAPSGAPSAAAQESPPPSPPARLDGSLCGEGRLAIARTRRVHVRRLPSLDGLSPPASPPPQAGADEPSSLQKVSRRPGSDARLAGSSENILSDEGDGALTGAQARKLAWRLWRKKIRADASDHEKMPCWKQYTVLFIGTILVAFCTITVTTLFTIIAPITQYFSLFSFAGSMPFSIALHFVARSMLRYLRKRLALRRGRRVEGTVGRKEIKGNLASRGAEFDERASAAGANDLLEASTTPDGAMSFRPGLNRSFVSAHLKPKVDQTQGLAERTQLGTLSEEEEGGTEAPRKRVTGVMTRNSSDLDVKPLAGMTTRRGVATDKSLEGIGRAASKGSAIGRAQKMLDGGKGGATTAQTAKSAPSLADSDAALTQSV